MKAPDEVIEVDREELQAMLERKREALGEEDYQKLQKLLRAFSYLSDLIGEKDTTISQLRGLLMKPSTEKTKKVLERAGLEPSSKVHRPKAKAKPGHGRNGVETYCGGVRIPVAHRSLKSGDRCPGCLKGKLYEQKAPGLRIRVVGQAPIAATVYALERLRCNLCGEIFEADAPEGVGEKKYDETAAAMIALLRYGSGIPFYRWEGLEKKLGISLPVSTQWEIVEETAEVIRPAFQELILQAGQGEVFHNDDTSMRILSLARSNAPAADERTGVFTSGIVTTRQGQRIALFFTGRRHAGENFAQVLAHRAAGLPPPIQMTDALSRNFAKLPEKLQVIVGNCNAHSRRRFVDVVSNFPEQCRYVLQGLAKVYGYDARRRRSAVYHQRSGCVFTRSTVAR
jgi:transposase